MKYSKLDVVGITYSHSQKGAYTLLLQSVVTKIKLPIIIGAYEAQAILMALEVGHDLKKPLTHDLFFNFLNQYSIDIQHVFIHHFKEGLFESYIYSKQNGVENQHVSRVSDAVALAVRAKAPIYVDNRILIEAGFFPEGEDRRILDELLGMTNRADGFDISIEIIGFGSPTKEKPSPSASEFSSFSIEELQIQLDKALEEENFELAAKIRDEINNRNQE